MNFDETINLEIPSLVDFYANWCGPCKFTSPIIDDIKDEYSNRLNVIKIDVDSNRELALKYNIKSIPTIILFKNGEIKETIKGATQKLEITSAIDRLI